MPTVSVQVRIKPTQKNVLEFNTNKIVVGSKIFTFSKIHHRTTQQNLYTSSVRPFIDKFLAGEDCSVLVYGQTGSGKTYTMGLSHTYEQGVIQYSLDTIFQKCTDIRCSFIEIYNEEIYDLLTDTRIPLNIRQGVNEINIVGLEERVANTFDEAVSILKLGSESRTTKCTKMNTESSRSHAIFMISLKQTLKDGVVESRLTFVDLAGSERLKRSACVGNAAKEAISINCGLLALGNVISALYLKKVHVPFRDSKLTRILQKCLTGNALLIACVSGQQEDCFETTNTLKYASRAAYITLNQKLHVENDKDKLVILNLKKEISKLKEENNRLRMLAMSNGSRNENIRSHPFVQELITKLKAHEGEDAVKKIIKEQQKLDNKEEIEDERNENKRNISREQNHCGPLLSSMLPKLSIFAKLKKNNKKADITKAEEVINVISEVEEKPSYLISKDKTSNTMNELNVAECAIKKRKRQVTFDLEPKQKSSLFTPLKEKGETRFTLVDSFSDVTAISLIKHNNKLLFNCIDSKIRVYESGVDVLVTDDSIRCMTSAKELFYSSRALLKTLTAHGRTLPVFAYKNEISSLQIHENLVITGHEDGKLCVLDLRSNDVLFNARVHTSAVFDTCLSSDFLYTCSRDHTVRCTPFGASVLNNIASSLDFVALEPPHYDTVSCVLPFEGKCVSVGRDCSLKVWEENRPFKTVPYAHDSWIRCGISLESRFVTGCKGGVLKCWSFSEQSVRCVGKLDLHSGINCMTEFNGDVWVSCQNKRMLRYALN